MTPNPPLDQRPTQSLLELMSKLGTMREWSPYYSMSIELINNARDVLTDRAKNIIAFTGEKPEWATYPTVHLA
jgi:hypothetical protein